MFFVVYPDFDLSVSRLVFDRISRTFIWGNNFFIKEISPLTNVVGAILVISLPIVVVVSCCVKKVWLAKHKRECMFLLAVLILGPGLIVNGLLKEHWGRPRPVQVIEFGGDKPYVSPFCPDFERKGYSFVSGDASVGFYFFCLALLARKRKWLLVPVLLGSVIGAARIVQGRHFFSDVLFSGWVVWFCSIFLYTRFFEKKHPGMNLLALAVWLKK